MKPDWKDAPEWAKWLARDNDGWWNWYSGEPEFEGDIWALGNEADLFEIAADEPDESGIDWDFACNTLEPRP